jgi:hypothetical protein
MAAQEAWAFDPAERQMSLKAKVYVVAAVLFLVPLVVIPIHRAHQVYNLSYADVLYNLIVNKQFAPK